MTHYKEVCEFGYTHGQCRCPDPNKTERRIVCSNPQSHMKPEGSGLPDEDFHVICDTPDNCEHLSHKVEPVSAIKLWCPKCKTKHLSHKEWTFFECSYCGANSQLFEVKL
jgi:hypothetical protein